MANPPRDASYAVFGSRLSYESLPGSPDYRNIVGFLPDQTGLGTSFTLAQQRYSLVYNRQENSIEREEEFFDATHVTLSNADGTFYEKSESSGEEEAFYKSGYQLPVVHVQAGTWRTEGPGQQVGSSTLVSSTYRFFVFGFPTIPADLPAANTSAYDFYSTGMFASPTDSRRYTASWGVNGDGIAIDFTTGELSGSMSFGAQPCAASAEPCGSFRVNGTLRRGDSRVTGTIDQVGGGYSGTFIGAVFGPLARDVGFALQMRRSDGAVVTGHLLGRKVS